MAIIDLISSVVSKPAGRILESSVRTLVNDLIRDHDLASAAEVDALRRSLRGLEGRADDLQAKLGTAEAEITELRDALANSNAALATANAGLAALQAETHDHVEPEVPAPAEQPTPAPAPAATPDGCQVPGCTKKHRSKGFCSSHYQRWRRGTLTGFVLTDGTVTVGDKTRKVNKKLAGRAYTVVDGKAVVAD